MTLLKKKNREIIRVYCGLMPYGMVVSGVSEKLHGSTSSVKQFTLLGLPYPEGGSITLLESPVTIYQSTGFDMPEDLNFHQLRC
jgi:hypothetical protein